MARDVFVTGTSGVLGCETLRHLFGSGAWSVKGVSRRPLPANTPDMPNLQVESVFEPNWLPQEAAHSTIVHFAGLSDPRAHFNGYSDLSVREIIPQIEMVEKLIAKGWLGHLIYISSGGSVYGDVESLPIHENQTLRPKGYYALQKVAVETALIFLANQHNFRLTILRIANPYGSQIPKPGQGVIPILLNATMTAQPFTVIGTGDEMRDYLHISDFCRAVEFACDRNFNERINTINVGSGVGTSLNQLINIIENLTGKAVISSYKSTPFDVKSNILDISRAKSLLNWSPDVTIEAGLRTVVFDYVAAAQRNYQRTSVTNPQPVR